MSHINFTGELDHKNKSVKVSLNMYLFKEGDSYIVYCPALDLSAYGNSEEHAKKSFEDVFEITIRYMLNKNTVKDDLIKHGWKIKSLKQKKINAPSFEQMMKTNESFAEILKNKEYKTYKESLGIPEFV